MLWMKMVNNRSDSRPGILFPRFRPLHLHHSIRISSNAPQMALLQMIPYLKTYKSHPRHLTSDSDLRSLIYEPLPPLQSRRYEHELPYMLPRSDHAVFTHGDIAPRNIMIDENTISQGLSTGSMQAGYPDYWEYAQIMRPAFWGYWSMWIEKTT